MNSTSIIAALVLAVVGYAVGHQHGGDVARLDVARSVEVVVADYPYAAACSAMLEAAWEVETPPVQAGSPHKP